MANGIENKCFVISEIGEPGSKGRAQADKYLKIVQDACAVVSAKKKIKFEAERLDGDRTVDGFFDEVLNRIMGHKIIVGIPRVNDKPNANANLEIGIALSAARPVILLVENRFTDVPSDLSNRNCIEGAISLPEEATQNLANTMLAYLDKPEDVLAFKRYNALDKMSHSVHYLNRFKDLAIADWSQMFWDAETFVTIAVTNLLHIHHPTIGWFHSRTALQSRANSATPTQIKGDVSLLNILLAKAAFEGVRVRVMFVGAGHEFLDHLVHDDDAVKQQMKRAEVAKQTRRNLEDIEDFITSGLATRAARGYAEADYPERDFPLKDGGSFELVELTRGGLYNRVSITDKEAVVTPYHLYEERNSDGPAFHATNRKLQKPSGDWISNNFYDKILEDTESLYRINSQQDGRDHSRFLSATECRRLAGRG